MKEGDIVITPLPQADGQVKTRPAIILRAMPPYGDFLVCGVSTQLRHEVVGFDDSIRPSDADFAASGLKAASLIRLGFLAVLPASSLLGAIGSIDRARHLRLLDRLVNHLRSGAAATEATSGGGLLE
jgi:mRNA interferase MazF